MLTLHLILKNLSGLSTSICFYLLLTQLTVQPLSELTLTDNFFHSLRFNWHFNFFDLFHVNWHLHLFLFNWHFDYFNLKFRSLQWINFNCFLLLHFNWHFNSFACLHFNCQCFILNCNSLNNISHANNSYFKNSLFTLCQNSATEKKTENLTFL